MSKIDLIIDALLVAESSVWSDKIAEALVAARELKTAQPEQEPEIVQRVRRYTGKRREAVGSPHINAKECIALANWIDSIFAAPPRKEWVGLTEDEIWECQRLGLSDDVYKAIEAKLKEKNT